MLAGLAVVPVLALLFQFGSRQQRHALAQLGHHDALRKQFTISVSNRKRSRLLLLAAATLIAFSLSGPRWGVGDPGIVSGRDLVIALDLSKSMLADDMRDASGMNKERWQAARAGVRELVESFRQRGGHRVGLVVFAGKPWLVCPLTADYEHFLLRLDEFDPQVPPPEINPARNEQLPSGTRIGTGVAEAVQSHDPRFPGQQDVLLLSDGDDPADDRDREVAAGIGFVQERAMPVHTVGVGDPDEATTFTYKRSDGEEDVVGPTRLHEQPLREISKQTGGQYLAARRDRPNLAAFFRQAIEPGSRRELPDDALPQPRDRSAWFLFPGIILLLLAWRIAP